MTPLASLTTASGTTLLNGGSVTTTGPQSYDSGIMLGASTTLTSTGAGDITFDNFVTTHGFFGLTVNTAGTTAFNEIVGTAGGLGLQSLTTDAPGTTLINADLVLTRGAQTYGDAVTLGVNTTLTATEAGNVTFNNSVNANGLVGLTVNTAGTTAFNGAVGGLTALTYLTTDTPGTTSLNGGSVTTLGSQTYNDPVVLGADATLTGGALSLLGLSGNNHALTFVN
ncbi:MAG TPA: hypothetical protein VHS31_04845, partial [Tepidisphaeraceae bacterium]|nr:hypothetical protein [Tepidisphaeraceae bacterium]